MFPAGKIYLVAMNRWQQTREYNDGDFIAYPPGKGSAGTDGTRLQNRDAIFESRHLVVAGDECWAITNEARTIFAQGIIVIK